MNERIKELWWKARIGYNEQNCDPEVLEKFAELIVRECMLIANTYQNRGGNCYVDDMISKHFGVEE